MYLWAVAERRMCVKNSEKSPVSNSLRTLVLALALIAALSGSGIHSGVATGRPLITGVSGVNSADPLAMSRVREAGASFVHISLQWHDVSPEALPGSWYANDPADPNYDWSRTDSEVRSALQHGLQPILLVDGGPRWAQRCHAPSYAATKVCDPDPAALATFATVAARRYSGTFQGLPRVRYWQGLNEPNLSLFFNPQFANGKPVSPDLYRRLINVFYDAIKAVDPSNIVLAAGLGPVAVPNHTVGPLRFTRALLCMKGRRNPRPAKGNCEGGVRFDILDIHPYTTGGPLHEGGVDDVALGDLDELQSLLRAADASGRVKGIYKRTPIWATEFSWDSKPPDPGGLQMRILTRWTAMALYQAWEAGISHFFWYSLRDAPTDGKAFSETVQSGLYFRGETLEQDQPKRMLSAFRFPFVAFGEKDGFSFWGRTPTSEGGRVTIEIKAGGGWRRSGVARADRNGVFRGEIPGVFGRNGQGFVRARFRRDRSVPFSLREVKDSYQPPFG